MYVTVFGGPEPKTKSSSRADRKCFTPPEDAPRCYRTARHCRCAGACSRYGRSSRLAEKGYHLVLFFDRLVPAGDAKAVGEFLMRQAGSVSKAIKFEVFPKQDRLTVGMPYGNLIKLPWGKHKLGSRSVFVNEKLQMIGPWPAGQIEFLEKVPVNKSTDVTALAQTIRAQTKSMPPVDTRTAIASALADGSLRKTLAILQADSTIHDLFRGVPAVIDRYNTRSGAEFALVLRLLQHQVPDHQINEILHASGIGKWAGETEHYRQHTLHKAKERLMARAHSPKIEPATPGAIEQKGQDHAAY